MTPTNDQNLVSRAMAGDTQAFRALVEKNQSFVYAVAYRFVNSRTDAEDVSQEAFVRLWKNLGQYRPEVKLTTWLYKIVTNLCLDLLKSRQHKNSLSQRSMDDSLAIADSASADAILLEDELRAIILRSADELTPKQKAVFILRDIEGLSVDEVCSILGMSAGNVKSNLYYARLSVTERIKQFYSERKKKVI